MFIITRRIGETVIIGDKIKVVVVGVNGRQCRIGIDAPKNVTVLQEELANRNKHNDSRQGD